MIAEGVSARDWWSARRRKYNIALAIAGLGAFLAYGMVPELPCTSGPEIEITLFTIPFQAFGYLVVMAIANLCFNLGRWLERGVRPQSVALYRRWAWGLGCGFSVILPFTIPIFVAVSRCRGQ